MSWNKAPVNDLCRRGAWALQRIEVRPPRLREWVRRQPSLYIKKKVSLFDQTTTATNGDPLHATKKVFSKAPRLGSTSQEIARRCESVHEEKNSSVAVSTRKAGLLSIMHEYGETTCQQRKAGFGWSLKSRKDKLSTSFEWTSRYYWDEDYRIEYDNFQS